MVVDPAAKPRFHRPRSVPFALKKAVEEELDRMERAGVIEKVDHSEWAAPIVVVSKKDGRVRLCGDYKVTVNPFLDVDHTLAEFHSNRVIMKAFCRVSRCSPFRLPSDHDVVYIPSIPWIVFWKSAGAEATPKGNRTYRYSP